MHRFYGQNYIKKIKYQAFGLIEVMIAATILSLSLLGLASIQSRSLNAVKESSTRETAVRLIDQISSFFLIMDQGEISNLNNILDPSSKPDRCIDSYCNRTELFTAIIADWRDNIIKKNFPGGQGCFCLASTAASSNNITIRIGVKWTNLSGNTQIEFLDNQIFSTTIPSLNNCDNCKP